MHNINITGLNLPKLFDGIERKYLSEGQIAVIEKMEKDYGDQHYFMCTRGIKEGTDDSLSVRSAYFFADIAPNSTKTVSVSITSDETIEAWFTVPNDWFPIKESKDILYANARNKRGGIKEWYCCVQQKIECIVNFVADVVGIANAITSAIPTIPAQKAVSVADCVGMSSRTTQRR